MAHLSQKLAEMHRRLAENAQEEQALIRALDAALNHVDEKLLEEIRQVTAHHEQRRAAIMGELQQLAGRLCAIPLTAQNEPLAAIETDVRPVQSNGHQINGHVNGTTHAPGNWRIAAQNIQDDLDFYSDPPPASH
jgi:hypothetical protein